METVLNGLLVALANLYAVMAMVPFVTFFLLWFIFYAVKRDKKTATRRTMDIVCILLVGSVSSMYYHIFNSSFALILILFLMLLSIGLIGNMQYRSKGSIDYKRILQVTLRIGFLGLSVIYVILLLIGTVKYYMDI